MLGSNKKAKSIKRIAKSPKSGSRDTKKKKPH